MAVRFPLLLWEALQSQLIEELCLGVRKWLEQTHAFLKIHKKIQLIIDDHKLPALETVSSQPYKDT